MYDLLAADYAADPTEERAADLGLLASFSAPSDHDEPPVPEWIRPEHRAAWAMGFRGARLARKAIAYASTLRAPAASDADPTPAIDEPTPDGSLGPLVAYIAHPTEAGARALGRFVVDLVPIGGDPPPPDELGPDHLVLFLAGYYGEKARRAEAYLAERRLERGPVQ